jgi:acyl-CoA synthetase (AMP-forming)/AMP-acid ligase II
VSHPEPAGPAAAIAAALTALGVGPDDRILIMLPDGPGLAEALFGVTQRGAVALPVNPQLAAADVAAIAARTGARLVLASTKPTRRLASLGAAPPVLVEGVPELWATTLRPPREGDGDPPFS